MASLMTRPETLGQDGQRRALQHSLGTRNLQSKRSQPARGSRGGPGRSAPARPGLLDLWRPLCPFRFWAASWSCESASLAREKDIGSAQNGAGNDSERNRRGFEAPRRLFRFLHHPCYSYEDFPSNDLWHNSDRCWPDLLVSIQRPEPDTPCGRTCTASLCQFQFDHNLQWHHHCSETRQTGRQW